MGHAKSEGELGMNRRQFFKTIAATAAGVVAVGVAPKVVGGERPGLDKIPMCYYRGRLYFANSQDTIQEWTFSRQCAPSGWSDYYKDYSEINHKLLEKFEQASK
jgi:hypothetical protein